MSNEFELERRVCHPNCFSKYFRYKVSVQQIPHALVENIIDSLNKAFPSDASSLVERYFVRYESEGKLGTFIGMLRQRVDRFNHTASCAIIRWLYNSAEKLSRDGDLFNSTYDQAVYFLINLLVDGVEEKDLRPILKEIIMKSHSLHFMTLLVLRVTAAKDQTYVRKVLGEINAVELRALAASRLQKEYIEEGRDVIAEASGKDWSFILFQWGTDWMTGSDRYRSLVWKYVSELIKGQPRYVGLVLTSFVDKMFAPEQVTFKREDFCRLYDIEEFFTLLERYKSEVTFDDEESQAVDLFRGVYSSSHSTKE